jgi:hypothetical protein
MSPPDKKSLMPELLPDPKRAVIDGQRGPRQRVLRHMRDLVAAGAATLVTSCNCGYMVVDPIPPPARCRTSGALGSLQMSAVRIFDGGRTIYRLTVTADPGEQVALGKVLSNQGAAVRARTGTNGDTEFSFDLEPDTASSVVVLEVEALCQFSSSSTVRFTIQPPAADGGAPSDGGESLTVTAVELPARG